MIGIDHMASHVGYLSVIGVMYVILAYIVGLYLHNLYFEERRNLKEYQHASLKHDGLPRLILWPISSMAARVDGKEGFWADPAKNQERLTYPYKPPIIRWHMCKHCYAVFIILYAPFMPFVIIMAWLVIATLVLWVCSLMIIAIMCLLRDHVADRFCYTLPCKRHA